MRQFGFGITVAVLGIAAGARADDITVGGDARAFAMGGAGIATGASSGGASRNNVASLAFDTGNFRVYAPNLGIRSQGSVSQQRGFDYLLGLGSLGDAAKLVRDYGNRSSDFALNASAGVRLGHIEILTNGVGVGSIRPNSNGSKTDVTLDGIYSFPSVGAATVLPGQKGRFLLAIGGRIKYANVVHSHLIVDSSGNATPAPEMNGQTTDTRQGIAGDLGLLLKERNGGPLSVGFSLANAVKPKSPISGANFTTLASVGGGYTTKRIIFAADFVDLTQAAGKIQFRTGAEIKLGLLPIRAGYSSATGFTYGTRILGVDVAASKRQPLEIGSSYRF